MEGDKDWSDELRNTDDPLKLEEAENEFTL